MNPTERLREARIPPYVSEFTLETLKQPRLAAAMKDGMYLRGGEPTSLVLTASPVATMDTVITFTRSVARFAATLCVGAKQRVFYASVTTIADELKRHTYDPDADILNPVLSRKGKGFLVVPDISHGVLTQREIHSVSDFLIDHVTLGGALIVGVSGLTSDSHPVQATIEALTMMDTFQTVNVQL